MSAGNYLTAAHMTVKYVQSVMDIGASNKFPEIFWGFPARFMCVNEMRSKTEKELSDLEKPRKKTGRAVGWADQMESSASWAKHYGCGNCGEYSALAFKYLRDILRITPLDWMEYNNLQHAFVIIGRQSGTEPSKVDQSFGPRDIGTWSTSTVMCDAYGSEVLDYSGLVRKLGICHTIHLLARNE